MITIIKINFSLIQKKKDNKEEILYTKRYFCNF